MHPRKASRHAIRNILLGAPQVDPGNPVYPLGNTTPRGIGPRVYSNRPVPFHRRELPCTCIWTPEEDSDDRGSNSQQLWRECDHIIEVMFATCDDADDRADDYAEVIEALLCTNPGLKDPVNGLKTAGKHFLIKTQLGLVADESNQVYVSLKLTWRVEYQTQPDANTASLANFNTLHSEYEMGGNNSTREAIDHTTGINPPA